MNPTSFERFEQVGIVTYKRLRQNIRAERVVLIGASVRVNQDDSIWIGFAKAALADGQKILLYLPESASSFDWPKAVVQRIYTSDTFQSEGFGREVKELLQAGHILVLLAPSNQVSHLVTDSLSRRLDKLVGHPVLSISSLPFDANPGQPDELLSDCLNASEDKTGELRLGCAAYRVERKFAKKKLDPSKIWGVMERHGLKEYLLFTYQPQGG